MILNGEIVGEGDMIEFEDSGESYRVDLSNSVLHHKRNASSASPNATLRLSRGALMGLMLANVPVEALIATGSLSVDGDVAAVKAACDTIRDRMAAFVAERHQADPASVRFEGGRVDLSEFGWEGPGAGSKGRRGHATEE